MATVRNGGAPRPIIGRIGSFAWLGILFRVLRGLARRGDNDSAAGNVSSGRSQEWESAGTSAEGPASPKAIADALSDATVTLCPEGASELISYSHLDGLAPRLIGAISSGRGPQQEREPLLEAVPAPEPDAEVCAGIAPALLPVAGDVPAFGPHSDDLAPQPAEAEDFAEIGEATGDVPSRVVQVSVDSGRTEPVQDALVVVVGDEGCEEDALDDTFAAVPTPLTRAPGRYRPRLKERRLAPVPPAPERPPLAERLPASPALEADLVLTFRPGGWGMDLSLLLRRPEGMPDQIAVTFGREAAELSAIDDNLFEPVQLADADVALRSGIAVESKEPGGRRWVRTGRRLHVFTERAGVFGFTSVPRVVIGQENVILCESDLTGRVLELCAKTGTGAPPEAAGPGLPDGWRCFRGYRPRGPGSWTDDDIYLALSPLPDAVIEFTGGIATSRSTWITGRPPAIRILGALPAPGEVTVDSELANCSVDGQWTGPGWDELGAHTVRYAGLLRRYEIVPTEEDWSWWPAHAGPGLVLAGALASLDGGKQPAVVIEDQSAWLLGARPGEIVRTAARPGSAGSTASPAFRPVWSVPPKTRRRPVPRLLDFAAAPQTPADGVSAKAIRQWRLVIRDASDVPIGGDAATLELWRAYKAAARLLRRRSR